MKKILFSFLAAGAITFSAGAQVKQDNQQMMQHHLKDGKENSRHHGGMHGHMMMKDLNLTDAQKQQLKSDNQEFRNKMQALKKNDNMTMKDFKSQKEALLQERKTKFQALLTAEQRTKMQQQRKDMHKKMEKAGAERMEKMSKALSLSGDQIAKMNALHENTRTKIESIRNDQSLSHDQKKEQMMSLMKQNDETVKNLLTPEQLSKREELKAKKMQDFKNKKYSDTKENMQDK